MILESAVLQVRAGTGPEFELAFAHASKIISAAPGYVSHELQRCLELPEQYLLLVWWRRLEDHTVGFRGSPEYQQWRRLLHHFYDPFPIVEHYELAYPGPAARDAQRVTGLGGVFFKARDPDALRAWYQRHLGLSLRTDGAVVFRWRELERTGSVGETIWNPFPADTSYFEPGTAPFMVNYRVANLDTLLSKLRAEGIAVDGKIKQHAYGRFAWILDPEGNRIELWEPSDA
jgi:heme-degrading monooxygenase HmoA/predicted enzyme related to lactoylglutathione lyase